MTGAPATDDDQLESLLEFIRDARGFDFTGYKRSTLGRRIRKRMQEVGATDWSDYRDQLEIDADEFPALFNTILINVTGFFRDQEAWRYLQQDVVPELVDRAAPDQDIRIWSAGCASGEEAYSLAIVLAEALGIEECVNRVKIYGTDVDEEALEEARRGVYPAKAVEHVPEELRDRYFDSVGASYAFRPDLRRRVIFGRHDLTRDAPISRLDLLLCRNTLMYFNVEAQNQILERLHFALAEGGFLFLGKAEMLLPESERFEVVSKRHRIFRRRPGPPVAARQVPPVRLERTVATQNVSANHRRKLRDLMLEAAPSAIIGLDADGMIVAASAEARTRFGIASTDLNQPFHEHELCYRPAELRSVIEQARRERHDVRLPGVARHAGDSPDPRYYDIVVRPLTGSDGHLLGTTIVFHDVTVQTRLQHELKRVREDLETAYEELQSTNEELETTNEELQSSIEELETTNEELQSTNEELETTNEELQSGNEELETMNEELRTRSGELDESRAFLEGVLGSVGAGLVVLDRETRVQAWNRGAQDLWGLREDEVVGTPFFGLPIGLPVDQLGPLVQECVSGGGARTGPVELAAVNRTGRSITCAVTCSGMSNDSGGLVLMMEEKARR